MEVHAHTHTPRKKWTHYLWEFLMLFLAVFCGFLAEYQLEHKIERDREKQFMQSLITDLQTDTAKLNSHLDYNSVLLTNYDSLLTLLKDPNMLDHIRELYYYYLPTTYNDIFIPARRTIDQLENSGGLRLISNAAVSDSIMDYYNEVKVSMNQGETWLRYFDQYHAVAFTIFDYSQINTVFFNRDLILVNPQQYSLLPNDGVVFKFLYNKLFTLRIILQFYVSYLKELKSKSESLLNFLKEKYHFK